MQTEIQRAREALFAIPSDCDRDTWVRLGMAAKHAGLSFDDFHDWSAGATNYMGQRDVTAVWNSIKANGGVSARTLFKIAAEHGYRLRRESAPKAAKAAIDAAGKSSDGRFGQGAAAIWERCEPALATHPYIVAKQGSPTGLRVVPDSDTLVIRGQQMAGWLAVPVVNGASEISSLQFIAPPDVAKRLKAEGIPGKLNLPGAPMAGVFVVGELEPGGVAYLVEGIGTAWACWKATGRAAVVCFGWGMLKARAAELRERDASALLVFVPDVGKEANAEQIAREVGAKVAAMPEGWPANSDVCDLGLREGFDAVEALLSSAKAPPEPEPRYKLLTSAALRALPPLTWRVRGVLPASGLASIYGPSASGKSFLALDVAAAIACGRDWFGFRVSAAPVVYCALEGEAGLCNRVAAWESRTGGQLPVSMILQPFKLTEPQDVNDLAVAVIRAGAAAVTVIDTLNRAAPTVDENSSKDMGSILEAAKSLQHKTGGLVVLVHHTGKDATKGLRGHSSLFAALDAAIEVARNGERREWTLTKSKEGVDGAAHHFNLDVTVLGKDTDGEMLTSCVVVPDASMTEARRVKLPQGGNQRIIWEALKPLFEDGILGRPEAPPYRRSIELETAISRVAGRLACSADRRTERAREAITGLVSRGLLGCNQGWLWVVN